MNTKNILAISDIY